MYRDWIIPKMKREILKGQEFLATLSGEEMEWVVDNLVRNKTNEYIKNIILEGKVPTQEQKQIFENKVRQIFAKNGNKMILKVLKDEFKDVEIKIGINIANKQKDLVNLSDKLLSVFQFIFSNPQGFQQAMQIPALARSFEDILEFSGMNQADFNSLMTNIPAPEQPQQPQPQGQPQELALNPEQPTA